MVFNKNDQALFVTLSLVAFSGSEQRIKSKTAQAKPWTVKMLIFYNQLPTISSAG